MCVVLTNWGVWCTPNTLREAQRKAVRQPPTCHRSSQLDYTTSSSIISFAKSVIQAVLDDSSQTTSERKIKERRKHPYRASHIPFVLLSCNAAARHRRVTKYMRFISWPGEKASLDDRDYLLLSWRSTNMKH
jgi:hypothetical protein